MKLQIDNYARDQRLDKQEVIAKAVRFAHPTLSTSSGRWPSYAHLRRTKVEAVETVVITPKFTPEMRSQLADMKMVQGKSIAKILGLALSMFFKDIDKKTVGPFDSNAFSTFRAPTFYLGGERFGAPWIEKVPEGLSIDQDKDLLPEHLAGRTVYVGADFFLTMMTALELKNGPRRRETAGSYDIVRLVAIGKINLVTSAAEFHQFVGLGSALLQARDEGHLWELARSFWKSGEFARSGCQAMASRMACLKKMGVRIVPAELADYIGICEFTKISAATSFTTLLGLTTLAQISPGEVVMLRFLQVGEHPALLVWQEFSEDGKLLRMSSRDVKLDPDDLPEALPPLEAEG